MNSKQRAELLAAVDELCQRYPNWRLGQLIANVAGWADQEIWDVEDEQLLAVAQSHLQQVGPFEATQESCPAIHPLNGDQRPLQDAPSQQDSTS